MELIVKSGNLFIKKCVGSGLVLQTRTCILSPLLNLRFLPKRSLAMHHLFQMYSVDLSTICLSIILCLRGSQWRDGRLCREAPFDMHSVTPLRSLTYYGRSRCFADKTLTSIIMYRKLSIFIKFSIWTGLHNMSLNQALEHMECVVDKFQMQVSS